MASACCCASPPAGPSVDAAALDSALLIGRGSCFSMNRESSRDIDSMASRRRFSAHQWPGRHVRARCWCLYTSLSTRTGSCACHARLGGGSTRVRRGHSPQCAGAVEAVDDAQALWERRKVGCGMRPRHEHQRITCSRAQQALRRFWQPMALDTLEVIVHASGCHSLLVVEGWGTVGTCQGTEEVRTHPWASTLAGQRMRPAAGRSRAPLARRPGPVQTAPAASCQCSARPSPPAGAKHMHDYNLCVYRHSSSADCTQTSWACVL